MFSRFQTKISIWPLRHIAWCLQVVLQQGQVNTAHWLVSLSRCLLSLPRRPFSLAVSSTWNGVPSSPSWAGGSDTICVLQSHHLSAFNEPQFICGRWNRVFGGWKLVKAAWEGRLPRCFELLLRFTLLADRCCKTITFPIIKPRKQDQCKWSWSHSKISGFWEKAQIIRAFMAWLPLQTKSTCLITNVCKIRKYIQTNTRYTINTWDQVILSDLFYETLPKAQQTHALSASIENKTKLA